MFLFPPGVGYQPLFFSRKPNSTKRTQSEDGGILFNSFNAKPLLSLIPPADHVEIDVRRIRNRIIKINPSVLFPVKKHRPLAWPIWMRNLYKSFVINLFCRINKFLREHRGGKKRFED